MELGVEHRMELLHKDTVHKRIFVNKYKLKHVGKMNYMPACKHFDEKERTSFIISGGEKEYLDFKKHLEQENITIE